MKVNRAAVKIAMANACMNLEGLAKKAGMPASSVKNVIYGRSVSPRSIGQVCKALGVPVESLLEDSGKGC